MESNLSLVSLLSGCKISLFLVGDLVSVQIFGKTVILINSTKRAFDVFEKRSSNYSDRPRMTMVKELCVYSSS